SDLCFPTSPQSRTMSTISTPVKVLVLHGYSQNASIFSKRLGALRKQCGKAVDFVFIDGPIILQPADLMGAASTTSLGSEEGAEARGWFKWNASKNEAEGLAESLVMIRDLLKSQRFDGVFGFSQGAGMAGLLSAMLERPESYPPFLIYGQPPHPPFKFCVAVSGFRLNGAIGDSVFATTYKTPTLHVIGKTDIIVVEERSRKLVDLNESPRVEEHDGGHFVPSKGNWRKFLAAYLLDPTGDVPSPSAFSSSGTATPVEGLAMKL
ncbi:unnamed protein product, partial [Mycena citricolor]